MKEFVAWLFSENNSDLEITLFNIWHFFYLFIIFGGCILLTMIFRRKPEAAKEKIVRLFAYLTIGVYIADFFIMPLSDSYDHIGIDKLPFHICTLMATLVPFAQFNPKWERIKSTVVTLSIASSLMWMCYPGSALGGEPPFCYRIFQTFMFHGILFCWGVLNLTLGAVRMNIKNVWKEFVGILAILVWADFGNTIYDEQNWFFLENSLFPFLTDEIMPLMVVLSVFGVCLVIYGAYYAVNALSKKHHNICV